MKIGLAAPEKPSHLYLENDPSPLLDLHYLRISPWLWFRCTIRSFSGSHSPFCQKKILAMPKTLNRLCRTANRGPYRKASIRSNAIVASRRTSSGTVIWLVTCPAARPSSTQSK